MKFIISLICLASVSTLAAPLQIALNWKAEPEFGGFYAAELKGFYKKQGLEVEILQGGSGTPTVQMLANGKVPFAIVSADEIIISHDRKNKNRVQALFAVYQTSPYIIMTHKERGFTSLKDVFRSEGILSLQSGLPFYPYLVKKFGKPKAKVVPYLGGVGNFVQEKNFSQQGFITTEPLAAEKAGANTKSFLIAEEGFNPYLVLLATTEKTLKENPELVQKMIEATRLGWEDYLRDPKSTNEAMAKLNPSLSLETFHKAAEIQKPLIRSDSVPLGEMQEERWSTLVTQLKELKLIRSKPNVKDLYYSNKGDSAK